MLFGCLCVVFVSDSCFLSSCVFETVVICLACSFDMIICCLLFVPDMIVGLSCVVSVIVLFCSF